MQKRKFSTQIQKNNIFIGLNDLTLIKITQIDDIKGALVNIQTLFESMIKISQDNPLIYISSIAL